jgi:hypothetical protein
LCGKSQVNELLGFKLVSGDLFTRANPRWVKNVNWEIPDRSSLILWLQRLFLGICFPAERDTRHVGIEYSPLTLNVFLLTLEFLKNIGVPSHWLSDLLSKCLTNSKLKSKANIPQSSPYSLEQLNENVSSTNIHMFRQELSSLVSLWNQCSFLFPIIEVSLPNDFRWFKLPKSIGNPIQWMTGSAISPCVGIVFIRESDWMPFDISRNMRRDILNMSSSNSAHIFTALFCKSRSHLYFRASSKLISEMKENNDVWNLVVFRFDSWHTISIPHDVTEVEEAKI